MTVFWRLIVSFGLTVAVTLAVQYLFGIGRLGFPPVLRLMVADSALVSHEGDAALEALERRGEAACQDELEPIRQTGLEVWLVTPRDVVGNGVPPAHLLAAARRSLASGKSIRAISFRTVPIHTRDAAGVLLIGSGGVSIALMVARGVLVVIIPLLACLVFARHFSSPLVEIHRAALQIAEGKSGVRVGTTKGPRELVDVAAAFDTMAANVDQNLAIQRQMLGDLSHEVRSPLARIRLATSLIREGKGSVEANLNRIERDISRLDSLVGTVSHLVANTAIQPAESESLDLAELVGEVVEICGPEAASKGIELRPTFSPAPMKGDRTLLVSTAENLIGNALRYAPAGSHIEITVTNHPPRITVSDQGPGVPSGELNRIFDAFFRSSAARERQTGGVGLGLSIVRRAASAHGGQAWAENREGGGLAVSATFGS